MNKIKKKLCIVTTHHWSKVMAGSPYECKVLIESLQKYQEYDIYFICNYTDPSYKADDHVIKVIPIKQHIQRFGDFVNSFQLLKTLREIKPDIIYQIEAGAYTGVCAFYAKRNDCNMVWRIQHDHDVSPPGWNLSNIPPFNFINNKLLDYGIANTNFVVAQSELQNDLISKYCARSADIIVPNFHPKPLEHIDKSDPIQVTWVANLKGWKRPELFIKLARDLSSFDNVRFIMCGKPQMKSFEKLKSEMDSTQNLTYQGSCSQDEVNELLAKSHIFVNTSLHEGFPHTYMQSWMRKVPVISLAVNPDGVFNNNDIGLYSSDSYDKLREQVKLLIEDTNLRNEMGKNAQKFAFENYSADVHVPRLLEMLEK